MEISDLKKMIGQARELPTLPSVIAQMFQVLNDPQSSAAEAAAIVRKDQTITAHILRLVNSAAYGLGRKVTSIEESISLLGFSIVSNLAISASIMDNFHIEHFNMNDFWRHTIVTSQASEFFAGRIGNPKAAEMASSLGLIHDIGKLIFMMELPLEYSHVAEALEETDESTINIEQDILDVDHTQAGLLLAKHWGWPALYQDVIFSHHTPTRSKIQPSLNYCVYLGNLATHKSLEERFTDFTFSQAIQRVEIPEKLLNLFSQDDWDKCLETLAAREEETNQFLEVMG